MLTEKQKYENLRRAQEAVKTAQKAAAACEAHAVELRAKEAGRRAAYLALLEEYGRESIEG